MRMVTIGIELAKNVFAVHGVDATGQPALARPSVPRAGLLELIASRPDWHGGLLRRHHWAREFQRFEPSAVLQRGEGFKMPA